MKDINDRKDIKKLVDSFYQRAIKDVVIGTFFTEVVELNWEVHMPTMYDFWESTLFGKAIYKGNPMVKHIELNRKRTLLPAHFDRWLELWEDNISSQFEGETAQKAIEKGKQIAGLMQYKINQESRFYS